MLLWVHTRYEAESPSPTSRRLPRKSKIQKSPCENVPYFTRAPYSSLLWGLREPLPFHLRCQSLVLCHRRPSSSSSSKHHEIHHEIRASAMAMFAERGSNTWGVWPLRGNHEHDRKRFSSPRVFVEEITPPRCLSPCALCRTPSSNPGSVKLHRFRKTLT